MGVGFCFESVGFVDESLCRWLGKPGERLERARGTFSSSGEKRICSSSSSFEDSVARTGSTGEASGLGFDSAMVR